MSHTSRHPDILCLLLVIASRTLGALLVPILQMWTLMLRDVLPLGLWLCGECPHQCPPAPCLPQARPHPSAERRTCPPRFSPYHHQDHLWKDPPCKVPSSTETAKWSKPSGTQQKKKPGSRRPNFTESFKPADSDAEVTKITLSPGNITG